MDLREFLKILQLENSFTAHSLKRAYDNYCSSHRPSPFLNNRYAEYQNRERWEKIGSMYSKVMSFISENGNEKHGGHRAIKEASQNNFETRHIQSLGLQMTYIKPGSFLKGSPNHESGRTDSGEKQHIVTITKGFYLGVVPITQFQWHKVMGTHLKDLSGNEYFSAPGHPAYYVSWHDCQDFLANLNKMERSAKFRLPTEAEWEYACRAGSFDKFYYGDDESYLGLYAWYGGIKKLQRPREVGLLKTNPWGLSDMLGNVWEWCQDWTYQPGHIPVDSIDPSGPGSGRFKLLRGGSWHDEQTAALRCAARNFDDPRKRNSCIGFRVAMDI